MKFPIKIQHGKYESVAYVYAAPRVGDQIEFAFPGTQRLRYAVAAVSFEQSEGADEAVPFSITITVNPRAEVRPLDLSGLPDQS